MPGYQDPHGESVEDVRSKLAEGLKSCRAMVANYRAMLGAEQDEGVSDDEVLGAQFGHLAAPARGHGASLDGDPG